MLGDYDKEVVKYVQCLRKAGGIVNRSIVVAAAKGIVSHWNPSFKRAQWPESSIPPSVCETQATKAARKLLADFADIKLTFFRNEVQSNLVPLSLVLNWVQIGSKIAPVSEWTRRRKEPSKFQLLAKKTKGRSLL